MDTKIDNFWTSFGTDLAPKMDPKIGPKQPVCHTGRIGLQTGQVFPPVEGPPVANIGGMVQIGGQGGADKAATDEKGDVPVLEKGGRVKPNAAKSKKMRHFLSRAPMGPKMTPKVAKRGA